jgi:hypothetical protein
MPDTKVFCPYGGIVYPIGMPEGKQMFYFTPSLIPDVVYEGYRDEMEDAFVYSMKEILLLDEHYHSVAFASPSEREVVDQILGIPEEVQGV